MNFNVESESTDSFYGSKCCTTNIHGPLLLVSAFLDYRKIRHLQKELKNSCSEDPKLWELIRCMVEYSCKRWEKIQFSCPQSLGISVARDLKWATLLTTIHLYNFRTIEQHISLFCKDVNAPKITRKVLKYRCFHIKSW